MTEWEDNTEIIKATITLVAFVVLWGWTIKSALNIKIRMGEIR